ncbi:Nn.00g098320.m01.CDS01 [Neocucurbitaria sp. VM-36]
MTGLLRNKQGCWTCRLRKKKCDERRPHCSNYQTLSITCYGFGPKPEWMDNGEKEKAVANSLKEIVRHTSRRKATDRLPEQPNSLIRIEPKASSVAVSSESDSEAAILQDHGHVQHATTIAGSSDLGNNAGDGAMAAISANESALVVHYIDQVFPLQYPMYQRDFEGNGRGWLLVLLLRSKLPYCAVLALAAYHRSTKMLAEPARATALVQQEHFQTCLGLLAQSADNERSKFALSTSVAVIQVMFFELFSGNNYAWRPHLHAIINMFQRGHNNEFAQLSLNEETRWILSADLPLHGSDAAVAQEVVCFRFVTGTILWLDIVASITAGKTPLLLSHHSRMLAAGSQTQLREVMGCENWVLLQISRISRLHENKVQAIQQGKIDLTDFEKDASEINFGLQYGISQISSASPPPSTTEDPHTFVTQMFAYMAAVYLHLVIHGFQKLYLLDKALSNAMGIIRDHTSSRLLQAMVAPLFVIGTIAKQEDQQCLRYTLASPPLVDPFLRHRTRLLPMLEIIWKRRETFGFAWSDCVELTKDVLLV